MRGGEGPLQEGMGSERNNDSILNGESVGGGGGGGAISPGGAEITALRRELTALREKSARSDAAHATDIERLIGEKQELAEDGE